MKIKTFEVRDSGTFIPVMAIPMESDSLKENYLLSHSGFFGAETLITLMKMDGLEAHWNPEKWEFSRTMRVAHEYIQENYNILQNGQVVDVEFILGETSIPKVSQYHQEDKIYI